MIIHINFIGNVGIGQTSPNVTLGVSGSVNITGALTVVSGANISNGLNVISGNVGIGTTTPGEKLHVSGNINASGTVFAPVVNTTTANLTISSASGSVIIRLG